jgi:hypothetical protein
MIVFIAVSDNSPVTSTATTPSTDCISPIESPVEVGKE